MAHTETPHPACHKCNSEIIRLREDLDLRTVALQQAVELAQVSLVPVPATIDKWRHYLGWPPLTDDD
jgi:hypothetical protein